MWIKLVQFEHVKVSFFSVHMNVKWVTMRNQWLREVEKNIRPKNIRKEYTFWKIVYKYGLLRFGP